MHKTGHTINHSFANKVRHEIDCRIICNESLSKHTSLRIGGPAREYVYPRSVEALSDLIELCRTECEEFFVIGYGTNLLVCDSGFKGCVIDLSECSNKMEITNEYVVSGCGIWLGNLIRFAAENGYGGTGKLSGIPGGLGGALAMNAGAFGSAISDYLIEVEVVDFTGLHRWMSKEEIGFGYRLAPGLKDKIAVRGRFKFPQQQPEIVINEIDATLAERFRRSVMTLPSAGSVFKNPSGYFSARLIESVVGKGTREGNVMVSPLHANIIVNTGGGTADDVVRLIQRIRRQVLASTGISLKLEIRTIGFNGELDAEE